ncbi:FecR family protein [Nitrospira sp. T9]|uniref:FecR family protein n=1 Tax=unclassified Nitrospira TaxID=2652172 RepID=UPI003F96F506
MTTRHKLQAIRKISLILLTAIMLCASLVIPPKFARALGNAPGDIAAYLVGLRGKVDVFVKKIEIDEDGKRKETGVRQWIPARKGYALHLDARVRTGRGRVALEFTDRDEAYDLGPSVFNLGDNTEVEISDFHVNWDRFERDGCLDLIRGKIEGFIKGWGGQSGFCVRCGVAVIGVRGTEFTVDYDPSLEIVTVQVTEGEVVLTGPGGSRLIKTGENATMIGGAFPAKPPT